MTNNHTLEYNQVLVNTEQEYNKDNVGGRVSSSLQQLLYEFMIFTIPPDISHDTSHIPQARNKRSHTIAVAQYCRE